MKPDNISLRDWFAGMAMQGIMSGDPNVDGKPWSGADFEKLSKHFYRLADAMMEERLKNVKGR